MRMFFSQETKILQSMPKVDCSIARTEPTGVPLSATPPMGQSDRYERFFYPVCFHSDTFLLNPCPYSRIFFPPHIRKFLEVSYRMAKRSKEFLAPLLAMTPSKFGSLTRWLLPEKRYSDRHRRPGSEGRGYSVRWYRLIPAYRATRNPVSRGGRLRRGETQN